MQALHPATDRRPPADRGSPLLRPAKSTPKACRHCANPVPEGRDDFCCEGCKQVFALVREEGLGRYYALRDGPGQPAIGTQQPLLDDAWIEVARATLEGSTGLVSLSLDVEGLHCTACVWLIEEIFRRHSTSGRANVNSAIGVVDLVVEPAFPLRTFVEHLAKLGYRLGPRRKHGDRASDDLILRMGVCIALSMNVMIFAIARYAGLGDGVVSSMFRWLELALALAAFWVGGMVFVRKAFRGLRSGLLLLDLPIAVGLVFGYLGSIASLFLDQGRSAYFDTLIVFTTLMLLGRFLRERVLEKNRAQLLEDAGIDGLLARRLTPLTSGGQRVDVVPVTELVEGDELLVVPGDVVPVRSVLLESEATMAFDWITGESEPRAFSKGSEMDAGAANQGTSAIAVRALESFSASRLVTLLRVPRADERYGESESKLEARIARWWVGLVLVAAAAGLAIHLALGDHPAKAISVMVSILVVTCPCAFGIATPIAHELVLGALRKRGMLVRSATFLERATQVRQVVFDKTGTLTTGTLRISDASAITRLSPEDQSALYDLAARSAHPKAGAVRASIPRSAQTLREGCKVEEVIAKGLASEIAGSRYRLGSPQWLNAPGCDLAFEKNGAIIATFSTEEDLRDDAASEIGRLTDNGIVCWMATGDDRERALALASRCGLQPERVFAGLSPEDKAALVTRIDGHDTLMVGDGINDGLAIRSAHCSGTLPMGRTFMAARADFYLLSTGLGPVRAGLDAAWALRRTTRRNLLWAGAYNTVALALSYAGLMSPLLAALMMPASSLVSIALVVRSLGRKGNSWTS